MTDLTITKETDAEGTGDKAGRFVARSGKSTDEAVLNWRIADDGKTIVAHHTGVPRSMGGMGVGTALVAALIADAREHNARVEPTCSFVAAKMRDVPEWRELIAN